MNTGSVPVILSNSNKVIITSSNIPNKPSPNLRLIQNSSGASPNTSSTSSNIKDHEFYKKHPKEIFIKFRNPNCDKHIDILQFNNDANTESNLSSKEVFIQRERFEITKMSESSLFGAGTEFGKEAREEARIRKMTLMKKKAEQKEPITLSIGRGRNSKRFKAMRLSMFENSQYCVLLRRSADSFEAIPVKDWFKMNLEVTNKFSKFEDAIEEMQKMDKTTENANSLLTKKYSLDKTEVGPSTSKKMKKDFDDEFGDRSFDRKLVLTNNDKEFDSDSSENNEREILKKRKNEAILRKIKLGEERDREESDVDDHQGDELDYMTHSSSDEDVLPEEDREKIYNVNNIDEEGATHSDDEDINEEEQVPSNKEEEVEKKQTDIKEEESQGDSDSDDSSTMSSIEDSDESDSNQATLSLKHKLADTMKGNLVSQYNKKNNSSMSNMMSGGGGNISNISIGSSVNNMMGTANCSSILPNNPNNNMGNINTGNCNNFNNTSKLIFNDDKMRSDHKIICQEMIKYLMRKPISKHNLFKKLINKKMLSSFDSHSSYKLFEYLFDQLNTVAHIVNGEKLFSVQN